MSKLNLPPIKKTSHAKTQEVKYYAGISSQQVAKLYKMGLNDSSISELSHYGVCHNIGNYLYSCRMAGIPSSAFVEIAKSRILKEPPDVTVLRNYYGSLPSQPLLAMLAYRVGIAWKEIPAMKNSPDFTQENLYAMLDLQGEKK